jgi:hypothetical protein
MVFKTFFSLLYFAFFIFLFVLIFTRAAALLIVASFYFPFLLFFMMGFSINRYHGEICDGRLSYGEKGKREFEMAR